MHNVTIDQALPTITGAITNADDGLVNESSFNTTWTVNETGPAGLDHVEAYLVNNTSGAEHTLATLNTTPSNPAWSWQANNTTRPWPNTTYELALDATDHAGNTNTTKGDPLAIANVQIRPHAELRIPGWEAQLMNDILPNRMIAIHLPDYPYVAVDEANITLTNTSSGVQVGANTTTDHERQLWETPWEGPKNASESVTYNVTAAVRHGTIETSDWWHVERRPPVEGGKRDLSAQYRNSDLERGIMFGQLNGTGDEDAFLAEYRSCDADEDPYVRFDVRGMDGDEAHRLDLRVQDEDGQWYNDTNTTDPTVTDDWPSGDTYTYDVFLANADEGRIGYEIRYQTECHGDGGNSDPDGGDPLIPK